MFIYLLRLEPKGLSSFADLAAALGVAAVRKSTRASEKIYEVSIFQSRVAPFAEQTVRHRNGQVLDERAKPQPNHTVLPFLARNPAALQMGRGCNEWPSGRD